MANMLNIQGLNYKISPFQDQDHSYLELFTSRPQNEIKNNFKKYLQIILLKILNNVNEYIGVPEIMLRMPIFTPCSSHVTNMTPS